MGAGAQEVVVVRSHSVIPAQAGTNAVGAGSQEVVVVRSPNVIPAQAGTNAVGAGSQEVVVVRSLSVIPAQAGTNAVGAGMTGGGVAKLLPERGGDRLGENLEPLRQLGVVNRQRRHQLHHIRIRARCFDQ